MSETTDNQPERQHIEIQPKPGTLPSPTSEVTVSVERASRLELEDASNLKYLRVRAGTYTHLPQALYIVLPDGERRELTVDNLPEGDLI